MGAVHRVEERREPLQRRVHDRLDAADRVVGRDERLRRHREHDVGLALGVTAHGAASRLHPHRLSPSCQTTVPFSAAC